MKGSGWLWAAAAAIGGFAAWVAFETPPKAPPVTKKAPSGGVSPPAPGPPLLPPGGTVLLLGDSVANGLRLYGKIRDLLVAQGYTLRFAAKDGATISYWASQPPIDMNGVDVVILSLGSNDSLGEGASLDKLLASLRVGGAKVVWLVPPMYRPGTAATVQQQGGMAAMFAARDVEPLVVGTGLVPLADGVHPTTAGYQQLAANILAALTMAS